MKIRSTVAGVVIASGLALAFGFAQREAPRPTAPAPTATAQQATAVSFKVDPVHSAVIFKIGHMGVGNFYGRFNDISGKYSPTEGGSLNFEVKVDSVDTANEKRDEHLRHPDFFDAEQFPTISFKSSKVEKAGENKLRVSGDFSMHGVTKPITVDVQVFPARDTKVAGFRGGLETTFTIKQTDFGMSENMVAMGALSDEVTLIVAVEGTRE
jgi:polyisoprenoid-binding protein YceI